MSEIVDKVEILSDAWYGAFSRLLAEAVQSRSSQLKSTNFTMCEVITDCPGRGIAAHWFIVKDGRSQFGRGLKEDADARLTVPYEIALHVARTSMADLDAARGSSPERQSQIKLEGRSLQSEAPALAEALREVHDRLVSLVA